MIYHLKNCRNGKRARYYTTVEILENGSFLTFRFVARHSEYNCPYRTYNAPHYEGDACEIFIGSDPQRRIYYEIEITPFNDLFLAKITYKGKDECENPILQTDFVEESFVKSNVLLTDKGYTAELSFDKNKVLTGDGEMFFNTFRLETDGTESEKHLFALNPTIENNFHVPDSFVVLKEYLS